MRDRDGNTEVHEILPDIVDYVEPVMLIVGSRGLGNLKGYASYSISVVKRLIRSL